MSLIKAMNFKKGIFFYSFGIAFLTLLTTLFKMTTKKYHLPVTEILFFRHFLILIFLTPFMIKDGVKGKFNFFNKEELKPNVYRHILFSISTFFWYSALPLMPVNEIMTISFIVPVLGSVFCRFLFKRTVFI